MGRDRYANQAGADRSPHGVRLEDRRDDGQDAQRRGDYKLGVSIKGSTVSVTLNDQSAVGFVFNAVGVDGRFGLFTKGASASFYSVSVQTNDPTFATAPAGSALIAAHLPLEETGPVDVLTAEALRMVSDAAEYLWMESDVLTAAQRVALEQVEIGLGELGGLLLGVTVDGRITIDVDAGGHGWFVDPTPLRNEEFAWADTALVARNGTAAVSEWICLRRNS